MKKKYYVFTIIYLLLIIPMFKQKENLEVINETISLPQPIVIELSGEVAYPGIYTFYEPIYLEDVIIFAGNLTKDADVVKVNFNQLIDKSKKIYINKIENEASDIIPIFQLLDLNKVSFSELIKHDFMTETRAANIIIYRNENGRFNSVEELLKVKGIGSATFENISKYFKV